MRSRIALDFMGVATREEKWAAIEWLRCGPSWHTWRHEPIGIDCLRFPEPGWMSRVEYAEGYLEHVGAKRRRRAAR